MDNYAKVTAIKWMSIWIKRIEFIPVLLSGCFGFIGLPLVYLGVLNTMNILNIFYPECGFIFFKSRSANRPLPDFLSFPGEQEPNLRKTENSYPSDLVTGVTLFKNEQFPTENL